MENELLMILVAGGLTAITQFFKQYLTNLNALFFAGCVAVVLGIVYAFLTEYGILTEQVLTVFSRGFAYSVLIFQIFKQSKKLS